MLPFSIISQQLNVPLNTIRHMDRQYFSKQESKPNKAKQTPTMNVKPEGLTSITMKNLTPDELAFIVS